MRPIASRLLALAFSVAVVPGVAALLSQQSQPPAVELAAALQRKYDQVRDFSADFVHVYEGGALRKKATERGSLLVKKPGKMRWSYTAPEEKLFVSDGEKIYSYIPADRQVIVSSMPADDRATTPVLFLVGKGNLTRDFQAAYAEGPSTLPSTYSLRLEPRRGDREYKSLVLVVDRGSLQIRRLVANDDQGGVSTFDFANLKENVGLADKLFSFKIPRGVDVVSEGRPGRESHDR